MSSPHNPVVVEMSGERKSVPQSKLIGMNVYNSDATYLGEVKDIGLIPGEKNIMLHVQTKAGPIKEVDWELVAAVADIILLKTVIEVPQAVTVTTQAAVAQPTVTTEAKPPLCPQCGKPATWIKVYKRWYCYNCKRYL